MPFQEMKMKTKLSLGLLAMLVAAPLAWAGEKPEVVVYKNPWCGCCEEWAEALRKDGYPVVTRDQEDLGPTKKSAGIPSGMESCHTAKVDGYVLEGHVPLEAISKLLSERPAVAGLAVPGMPQGSLGMGDDPNARYDVLTLPKVAGAKPEVFYRAGAR